MLSLSLVRGAVDVSGLFLAEPGGENLIANADFSGGRSRWFFTSDHDHLPWHVKQLPLSLWFDTGAVGLALWLGLLLAASLRLARAGEWALLASLLAFCVVGAFDSLLDVPRLSLVFHLLLFAALRLPLGREFIDHQRVNAAEARVRA